MAKPIRTSENGMISRLFSELLMAFDHPLNISSFDDLLFIFSEPKVCGIIFKVTISTAAQEI